MKNALELTTHELWISSDCNEVARVHACIEQLLVKSRCTVLDQVAVRMAIEEAVINAITHGNQQDPRRQVHVVYWIDAKHFGVRVEDEGEGFEPTVGSSLQWKDASRGRGLLIMRRFMHEVAFDKGGCVVTMKRFLSDCTAVEKMTDVNTKR